MYSLQNDAKIPTMTTVWTSKLFCIVIIITAGPGFHHGYHTGVTNIPEKIFIKWILQMESERSENSSAKQDIVEKWSTTVAVFPLGGILGGFLTGFIFNKCGPKKGLIWNNFVAMIGGIILTAAKQAHSYRLFVFGRFFVGINAGLNCGLCQIYLMEIAPAEIRGAVGGCYQFMMTVGVMASQLAGTVLGTDRHWPFIFMVPMMLSALQILSLPFCPESPIYLLITKDDEKGAENALKWLRATEDVTNELDYMIQDDNLVKELRHVTFKRMFTDKSLKMSLFICSLLMAGQQFTGIKVIVYYSTQSFRHLGVKDPDASNFTLSITALFVLTTFLGLWMLDFVGRRKLLLFGFLCLSVLTSGLTVLLIFVEQNSCSTFCMYMSTLCYAMFIVCYSPGIGCIPWFYTAEIFHHTARPLGVSIAVPVNWLGNFIVGKAFWPLTMVIGYYAYLAFVVLDLFFFFSIYMYLPETAKLSTQNIIKFYKQ